MVNSDLVQLTFTGTTWIVEGRKKKKSHDIYLPAIISKRELFLEINMLQPRQIRWLQLESIYHRDKPR